MLSYNADMNKIMYTVLAWVTYYYLIKQDLSIAVSTHVHKKNK